MSQTDVDVGEPQEWKKYSQYYIEVDPNQDDKAKEIKMCSFARPHMRAFHCAWWGFFMAFFVWFAIAPLLSEIRKTLKLTKHQVWNSSIIGVSGTIFMRFILGPMCDKFGPRIPFAVVLCAASIPVAMTGLVQSAHGLYVLRLFIGIAGGTFVMTQFWTSRMFTKEVVGSANAITGGWGNLGGGVTQLVMGSLLFPLFKNIYDGDAEKAWRTACVVPAIVTFVTGVGLYVLTDDSPKGNYGELKKQGSLPEISATASFKTGAINFNTWLLFIQYACCFGVELTMDNAAALYFKDQFGQSTESAGAIASIFGWLNVFARGSGGVLSDVINAKMGMRGRILLQTILLLLEGALVLIFAHTTTLAGSIVVMIFFSLFVMQATGTTYGIVPYVNPPATGAISGIIGAGGNVGAVCFGLCFRELEYKEAFIIMGWTVIGSAFLSIFISIKGHASLLWGQDQLVDKEHGTIIVPGKDKDVNDDVNA